MANETMKAADLIGKKINAAGAVYNVTGVEGDRLTTEFWRGDKKMADNVPVPFEQVKQMLESGQWTMGDASDGTADGHTTAIPPATEDEDTVEEVSDIVPTKPATVVAMPQPEKPKRKSQPKSEKPKSEKPKVTLKRKQPQTTGQYVYATYENKRGKVCAKITGLCETDAAYQQAASLHASATYERDKQGGKVLMLLFGPRYAEVARQVCQALNEGKSIGDCQAIVDAATEERHQKREEYKQKRADYLASRQAKEQGGETMTMQEVADLMRRVLAGEADAIKRLNEINAKAA